MKTREGFVSNSSSSSFIIMVPKEEYTKAQVGFNDRLKMFAEEIVQEGKALGMDIVYISGWCDNGGGSEVDDLDIDGLNVDDLYKVYDELQEKLKALPGAFQHDEDW